MRLKISEIKKIITEAVSKNPFLQHRPGSPLTLNPSYWNTQRFQFTDTGFDYMMSSMNTKNMVGRGVKVYKVLSTDRGLQISYKVRLTDYDTESPLRRRGVNDKRQLSTTESVMFTAKQAVKFLEPVK